jgi:TonB family protein
MNDELEGKGFIHSSFRIHHFHHEGAGIMFQLPRRIIHRSAVVALVTLALCGISFGMQEAPRDSGSLIKPPTIKPPTARSQNNDTRVSTSRRRKRRTRRTRRRVAATRAAAIRVAGKPREVQGVTVDSPESLPNNTAEPSPRPSTRRLPVSGGVLDGRAISKPMPPYPALAKAANVSGTVVVRVLIDEDGKVTEAHAVSGHRLLRESAENAARNARFAPTQLSGKPVKVSGVITYTFVTP